MNILIVDDSKVSRSILRELLEPLGYKVVAEAVNGEDGIEKFKKFKPDLIISDIEMPVMDGIKMSSIISEHNTLVKIIVISSVVNKKITQKALLHGASIVLTKPIEEAQLIEAINGDDKCK